MWSVAPNTTTGQGETMKSNNAVKLLIGGALASCSFCSYAEVVFNGFASLRATSADSDGGTSAFPTHKADGDISFSDESLFALQARTDLGEGLSATIQIMAEGTDDFDAEARWAYISYELSPQHTISMGRFANPSFYQSEYQNVGFTNNFGRLPRAVYAGFDFSTIEGIALDSNFTFGDYSLVTKVLYGNWDGTTFLAATQNDETFGFKDEISVRVELSKDWWTVFAGFFMVEIEGGSVDSNAILGATQGAVDLAVSQGATAQQVKEYEDAVIWGGKDGLYGYSGFHIDYEKFIVDFEFANYGVEDSSDGFNRAWYTAFGYRLMDKTIVTVHHEKSIQDEGDLEFLKGISHPTLFATAQALRNTLSLREFDAIGVSVRYDFHSNAAFKFQYLSGEDTRPNVQDFTVLSAGVDIVF
ncbi:hypothetical protein N473_03600 [Pseudoalteromonas luteoviolacea CPMOR-1]|uniref:Porin domain-containing protein n=2 Tax=Pseudoalteromonas luteoviolacea TaxID=43657 RepID=A0A167IE88_9GAMM|nr:hypothetical protein N473_03600 [Pseudoalteromonas luteoviolacea CPMOR-1]